MTSALFKNNDMILSLTGLKDRDAVAITTATVQLIALTNRAGATPTGIVLPLAMTHTANGDYEAQIGAALGVEIGEVLTGIIAVDSGSGKGEWAETIRVQRRGA